jgi:hypothetical protein
MDAALRDGALLLEDGDIVVTNWVKYQEPDITATDRKRRQREKGKADGAPRGHAQEMETGEDVTVSRRDTRDVTRDTPVTRHVTPDPRQYNNSHSTSRAHAREEAAGRLAEWLGPAAGVLERFVGADPANGQAVDSIHATYAAASMIGEQVWGKTPEADRPPILADALEAFAGEGKAYKAHLFRVFVEQRIPGREKANGGGHRRAGTGGQGGGEAPANGTHRKLGGYRVEG